MRVLVVDDHPVILEVMQAVLKRALAPEEVLIEKNLAGAFARMRTAKHVDLVLLDLGLPDCSGMEALSRFREAFPRVPVMVLSAAEDPVTVGTALDQGARGYLPKSLPVEAMEDALKLVAAGGTFMPPRALAESGTGLTERQLEILGLMAKGLQNRDIAGKLDISEGTVKQHLHVIYRVLDAKTRTEALALAARRGLRF